MGMVNDTTEVEANPAASRIEGDDLVWDLRVEPDQEWRCELTVPLRCGTAQMRPLHREFGEVRP